MLDICDGLLYRWLEGGYMDQLRQGVDVFKKDLPKAGYELGGWVCRAMLRGSFRAQNIRKVVVGRRVTVALIVCRVFL